MSNPNINYSNLDSRYTKPSDLTAAISAQATTDAGKYAPISGSTYYDNAGAATAVSVRTHRPRVIAGFSDSEFIGVTTGGSAFDQAVQAAGGRVIFPKSFPTPQARGVFGVGGETTTQMLNRTSTNRIADLIACGADTAALHAGTNDIAQAVSESTLRTNLQSMMSQFAAGNVRTIVSSLYPTDTSGYVTRNLLHNYWLQLYCLYSAIPYSNALYALINPATGAYKSGMGQDGVHPSPAGAYAAGAMLAARFADPDGADPFVNLTDTAAHHAGFISNAVSMTVTSGTLPTGYTDLYSSGATFSMTTDANGERWIRTTQTSAQGNSGWWTPYVTAASLGWSVGDTLIFAFNYRMNMASNAALTLSTGFVFGGTTASTSTITGPAGTNTGYAFFPTVITSLSTNVAAGFTGQGTGWWEVNRPIVINLTKFGL